MRGAVGGFLGLSRGMRDVFARWELFGELADWGWLGGLGCFTCGGDLAALGAAAWNQEEGGRDQALLFWREWGENCSSSCSLRRIRELMS